MLIWRIEELDFSTGFKHSRLISIALHILTLLICLLIGEYSITLLNTKLNDEPTIIELEIINKTGETLSLPTRKKEIVIHERKETPFNVLSQESKTLAFEPQITDETSDISYENAAEVKSTFTKYEQQLSKHFYDHLPQLPKGVLVTQRLDLWVKIDTSGTIHDFGFSPQPTDGRVMDFLENFVAMSNPVPPPPYSHESYLSQYIIPIEFAK